MRRFLVSFACAVLIAPAAIASSYYHDPGPLAARTIEARASSEAWGEVQALRKRTPVRLPDQPFGRFGTYRQELLLGSDGRAAQLFRGHGGDPDSAWLGQYTHVGDWLQFELHRVAIDPAGFDAWWETERVQREKDAAEEAEWRAEHAPSLRRLVEALESAEPDALEKLADADPENFPPEFIEHLASLDAESRQSMLDDTRSQLDPPDAVTVAGEAGSGADLPQEGLSLRLLPIPYGDGWLLVDEDDVASMANSWNAWGRLSFGPRYWNDTPGPEESVENGWRWITIKPPLPARLPMALTTLLLDAPRLVTVSEWLDDPSEPTWKAHAATLRFRVDFGSAAGARAGMDLFGIAPDERWHATLDEVDVDSAVASLKLERFSPWEAVEVPTRGIRFSTRSPRSDSETCGFDSSAAVKANVTEVISTDAIEWDADGFAFLRLRIDQGRSQGLMKGDQLNAEDYAFGPGEGRVESVDAQEAIVLWRLQRFHPSMEVEPPVVGLSLVTPAWRRASYDTFGSWDAAGTATKVESEADAEAAE